MLIKGIILIVSIVLVVILFSLWIKKLNMDAALNILLVF